MRAVVLAPIGGLNRRKLSRDWRMDVWIPNKFNPVWILPHRFGRARWVPCRSAERLLKISLTFARRAALVCNGLFALCLTIVHLLDREPDPLVVSVSYYALTPHGWVATIGFLALAGGCAAVALIAWRSGDRPKSLVLLASSLAIVVLSIFPCDPWYPWERTPTTSGATHVVATCIPIRAASPGCLA
jgi:hypothetical protein